MTTIETLIEQLPPLVRAKVTTMIKEAKPFTSADAVLEALGMPIRSTKGGALNVYPLPSALTPAQRALAEIVALEKCGIVRIAMPLQAGAILRWL